MRIGIDLMGGDNPPKVLFEGVLFAAKELPSSVTLVVIGTHSIIHDLQASLQGISENHARIEYYPVSDSIGMGDEPIQAAARKKESSLVKGIRLLKKKRINAFVSAGNTGALFASAAMQLPRLPGIKRPALLVCLPTVKGSVAVLDVGGNVSCKAQHLVQFAYMGAAYQCCSEGIEKPAIGLLNIGVEPKKGTSAVREAYQLLEKCAASQDHLDAKMQFLGNIEGRDVFQGKADVLVTDGFTGNVLLKTAEGVSSFIFDYVEESAGLSTFPALGQALSNLKRYFSYAEYPGAFICGVEGIVIKCHGHSSGRAVLNGIKGAVKLIERDVISHLKTKLECI